MVDGNSLRPQLPAPLHDVQGRANNKSISQPTTQYRSMVIETPQFRLRGGWSIPNGETKRLKPVRPIWQWNFDSNHPQKMGRK